MANYIRDPEHLLRKRSAFQSATNFLYDVKEDFYIEKSMVDDNKTLSKSRTHYFVAQDVSDLNHIFLNHTL